MLNVGASMTTSYIVASSSEMMLVKCREIITCLRSRRGFGSMPMWSDSIVCLFGKSACSLHGILSDWERVCDSSGFVVCLLIAYPLARLDCCGRQSSRIADLVTWLMRSRCIQRCCKYRISGSRLPSTTRDIVPVFPLGATIAPYASLMDDPSNFAL